MRVEILISTNMNQNTSIDSYNRFSVCTKSMTADMCGISMRRMS